MAADEMAPIDRRILESAVQVARLFGDQRMTIDDVAAHSKVSRATIFRRFGSKERLVSQINVMEMHGVIAKLESIARRAVSPADLAEDVFVGLVRLGAQNPRIRQLAVMDRDRMLAAATAGETSPLTLGREFIATHLRGWQERGELRESDPDLLADFVMHLVLGYVLAPSIFVDHRRIEQIRTFARATVRPAFDGENR